MAAGEVQGNWKKGNIECILKGLERSTPGSCELSASLLCLEMIMEQNFQEAALRHMENRDMTLDSQHDFSKGKFWQIKLGPSNREPWSDYICWQGKEYGYHICMSTSVKPLTHSPTTSVSLNWREMVLMGELFTG